MHPSTNCEKWPPGWTSGHRSPGSEQGGARKGSRSETGLGMDIAGGPSKSRGPGSSTTPHMYTCVHTDMYTYTPHPMIPVHTCVLTPRHILSDARTYLHMPTHTTTHPHLVMHTHPGLEQGGICGAHSCSLLPHEHADRRVRGLHEAGRHSTPSGHSVMYLETKGLVGETQGGTQHITAPPFQAPQEFCPWTAQAAGFGTGGGSA